MTDMDRDLHTGGMDGHTRFERLEAEQVIVESDQPPPAYTQTHGEEEADVAAAHEYVYSAVVTAHFPDRATGEAALAQIQGMNFPRGDQAIQWFEKDRPDAPGDTDNDPGLAPGEVAIIVQLDDSQAAEVTRIFEQAGAMHAKAYPSTKITDASRNDDAMEPHG